MGTLGGLCEICTQGYLQSAIVQLLVMDNLISFIVLGKYRQKTQTMIYQEGSP